MTIFFFGLALVVATIFVGDNYRRWIPDRQKFEPPPCYVCGHPGPMGELVPKLPCCAACREAVTREVDAVLAPAVVLARINSLDAVSAGVRRRFLPLGTEHLPTLDEFRLPNGCRVSGVALKSCSDPNDVLEMIERLREERPL